MSVVYSLSRPEPSSQDTSTLATITANEGAQSAGVGEALTFTFQVPDGLWAGAEIAAVPGAGSGTEITAYADATGASGAAAPATGTRIIPPSGPGYAAYFFGDEVTVAPVDSNALHSLAPSALQGYRYYAALEQGNTATLQMTATDQPLSSVTAVMTLQSITPSAPYAALSGQAGSGGPPYTGTAAASLPDQYPPYPNEPSYMVPNGFGALSYDWENLPFVNGGQSASGGSGSVQVPGTLNDAWSFPALTEETGNTSQVNVTLALTNGPYPHQVDAPRSAFFGLVLYYFIAPSPSSRTAPASYALGEDAHARPVCLTPNNAPRTGALAPGGFGATSINGLVSNDAGKHYLVSGISDVANTYSTDYGADNPSLIVDYRTNHYRTIYSKTISSQPQLICATGLLDDKFSGENPPGSGSESAGGHVVIPNFTGGFPVCAQHPTDQDFALMVYSDVGGTKDLKTAHSLDCGATWSPLSTVVPALDLTKPGRPALCWHGETAVLVYSAGNTLIALTSIDRGKTWAPAAAPVAVYSPNADFSYYSLSAASHEGIVYLLAFVGDTQGLITTPGYAASPRLFASGDGGKTWTLRAADRNGPGSVAPEFSAAPPGVLPSVGVAEGGATYVSPGVFGLTPPSGIGVSPQSGLLRLDIAYTSHDGGLSWQSAVSGSPAG